MEHIKSFRINSLTVEGFKNFAEMKTFDFGDVNYVTGHNGLGKTTIADAIAYAIAGVPFSGEQSLDRLYAAGTRDMRVELSITADGISHTLIRERINDVTAITWDGVQLRQSDMVSMFGEKDVFLSVLNPLYFIEVLGDKGRNLLERCLPPVSHGDVMERLSDNVREVLKDARAMPSDTYLEKLRADIRELESGIVYTEGQRDMLALQSMDAKSKLADKRTEIAALDKKIAALEDKFNSADIPALKEFRGALYSKYEDTSHDDTISSETAKVAALFENARTRYTRENGVLKNLRPGVVCPTCKQRITEQNIDAVRKSFADSLAVVADEGHALKKRLAELKAQAEKRSEYMSELKAQIQSVEADIECGGLTPEEKRHFDTLKAERNTLAIELEALQKASQSEPSVKDGEIVRLKDAIAGKRELESAVKIYAQERYALMFRSFDTLNRVDIVLYDTVKRTGEAKGVFKFTYDGRPYKFLSLSEKIKAGLELSELMKKLTDSDYPVFIDNGESVPVIDNVKPSGQIFVSQVVKLAPLEVKVVDMPRADMLSMSYDLDGIPGFYRDDKNGGHWSLAGLPGILIPYRNVQGMIQGLQIRLDNDNRTNRRYRWLASTNRPCGTKCGTHVHITGNISSDTAYITEGALKGDAASFLDNDALFVCIAGIDATGGLIDTLKALSAKSVIIALDMDKAGNPRVRDAVRRISKETAALQRVRASVANWDGRYKGIDDYYLARRSTDMAPLMLEVA